MTQECKKIASIGLIGFGQVGMAMAGVLSGQFDLSVFDLDTARCESHPLTQSRAIKVAASATDLARSVDLLILCLPTPEASQAVATEIADAVSEGLIVLESSTVSPEHVIALNDRLSPGGARILDTALIGGIKALTEGRAVFLVGETEADAAPIAPVLELLAAEIFYFDRLGGGMRAKLVANAVSHSVYVVLAEALAVAAAQDIPLDSLYRLLARESGLIRPLTHRIRERLFQRNFEGGMSTANAMKDSRLFIEAAHDLKIPLFAIQSTHSIYEVAMREGMATDDYAIVGTLWEKWAGVSFAENETAE